MYGFGTASDTSSGDDSMKRIGEIQFSYSADEQRGSMNSRNCSQQFLTSHSNMLSSGGSPRIYKERAFPRNKNRDYL